MWLFGICRHAVVDVARKRTRDHVAQQQMGNAANAANAANPDTMVDDDEFEREMDRWQVADALKEMSTPQGQAVVQVHLRDRPYDVVAAELGVPVGTLESRIHVGLRTARKAGSSRRRIRPSGPT